MNMIKKYSIFSKVLIVVLIVFGLFFSLAFGIIVPYLIAKNNNIQNWLVILLFVIVTILTFSLYFILLIYPLIIKKKNKLSKFSEKHSLSVNLFILFAMITLVAITNQKEYNEQRISELLNVEWVIFGITIAFFTIWNALYLSKEKKKNKNPNHLVGIERVIEINSINSEILDNNSMLFSLVLLILNTILLVFTTSMFYINVTSENTVKVFSTISFYLCTNTMISIFAETIIPMFKNKLEYDSSIEEYKLDDEPKILAQAIAEEVMIQFAKKEFKDLNEEDKNARMEELSKKIIEMRNKNYKSDKENDSSKTSEKESDPNK